LGDRTRLAFSFSGLKTAVRYQIAPPGKTLPAAAAAGLPPQTIGNLAASFQEAVVDCLVDKSLLALEMTRLTTLAVGGGVAANVRLRERLAEACSQHDIRLHIAPPALCTDNAVMGAIALERLRAGLTEDLLLDVKPGLVR
jgi:N6-L-threonylcarbamoyladenine synthase